MQVSFLLCRSGVGMINSVGLSNFRNYKELSVTLSNGVNILCGDNAQGKTNFLEALYLCSTGRSQRTGSDREMIRFGQRAAMIQVDLTGAGGCRDKINLNLSADDEKGRRKGVFKGIAVNGLAIKKLGELFGVFLTVMFSPEDLSLVKSGPSERRRFMDMEICRLNAVYYYELQQYYKILRQRNNLLKSIKNNGKLRDTLFVWDEQMVMSGSEIIRRRAAFVEKISGIAARAHASLTRGAEQLRLIYKPNVSPEDFAAKLKNGVERDILLGSTSAGVHKDDIIFMINDENAGLYASQGQQRTAALSAKLAEIELIKQEKNRLPVLLLDDCLSELDGGRQKHLLSSIGGLQTVITCTGMEDITRNVKIDAAVYRVKNGTISRE